MSFLSHYWLDTLAKSTKTATDIVKQMIHVFCYLDHDIQYLTISVFRCHNCTDHDHTEHKRPELTSQGGLCNSYGLVYGSVLCFCLLCSH